MPLDDPKGVCCSLTSGLSISEPDDPRVEKSERITIFLVITFDYNDAVTVMEGSDDDHPQWTSYFDEERNECWMIVDEPDVEVNVTDSMFFRSLQPGESLIRRVFLGFTDLHTDTVVGDTYRYQYWVGCIDWTWGDDEEHAKTVVKLPCWLNDHVVEPADNDGRPVIMVPSSNFVEFTVVD
ncbi:hypothetical protein N7519_005176 [Penicillium mononematosum]|uniref:uncharacterized protein n=1 Tax=Penicillium mononematosum TaxID=268346 RepID=UPI0025488F07|nr:uncharacterized protein N7519_005176 [Penicillium mononematosum]KAJ6183875.1 hypothetical protein N7519_005176 [Penicillium mononematosum]